MTKKLLLVGVMGTLAFIGTHSIAATATEVVSADKAITSATNAYTAVTLSNSETSKPLLLEVFGSYPTNSPVVFFTTHTDGNGVVHTNNLTTIHCDTSGNASTNFAASAGAFSGYLFKRDPFYVKFSIATGGGYQLIGELYK